MNATKERFGADALPELFEGAAKVVVAKGKKALVFDMRKSSAEDADFQKAVLGPSGNLRAPAVRAGKSWLVGFHEESWLDRFG
ncbi:MAG TPA: hypothetical protein ENJ09_03340 [Planctomycetes bacterium]|nr:hypothetical protein [Planctomycetota bacterium]